MPGWLKSILTIVVAPVFAALTVALLNALAGSPVSFANACFAGGVAGCMYGMEAGFVGAYDLGSPRGWLELAVDMTWSLPNTVFGFLFGNLIYPFFGQLSREMSEGEGWVVFKATGSGAFGNDVLQTLGTVNLGGEGAHERVHLVQARIFGPLYLPIYGANYVVNFLVQVAWTGLFGLLLWKLGVLDRPYFRWSGDSAVGGFWGWIYRVTLFELWAYATE